MKREEVRKKLNELNSGPYDFDSFYVFIDTLMKNGPTTEEVIGFMEAVRDKATLLSPDVDYDKTIEVSGTGGDAIKSINVGSLTSLVLASAGLVVSKHSTMAYTGHSGSKEIFDHLGIPVDLKKSDPKKAEEMLEKVGFSAYYHSSFNNNFENTKRFVMELKERKIRMITPWHIASWLVCVVKIKHRIYGMYTDKYFEVAAEVLKSQGVEKGWILHGVDGLDEVSNVGETKVLEFTKSGNKAISLYPEDFGVKRAKIDEIKVSSAEESFKIADNIINGKENSAYNDLILINASAGLYLTGLANNLKDGVKMADELLKSGKVKAKVEEIKTQLVL